MNTKKIVAALRDLANALDDGGDAPVDVPLRLMSRLVLDELARLDIHGETPKAAAIRMDALELQLRQLRSDMQALRLEVIEAHPIEESAAAKALENMGYANRPGSKYRPGVKRVYFIQQGSDGPIKIGFTVDVRARLASLQTSSPHPLRLLLDVHGDEARERAWHERFAHIRLNGEWFRPDQELLDAIAYVRGERKVPPGREEDDDG